MSCQTIVYPSWFEALQLIGTLPLQSASGSVKLTYLTPDRVFQIHPSLTRDLQPSLAESVNRWIGTSPDRVFTFRKWLSILVVNDAVGSWNVDFPELKSFGFHREGFLEFPWILWERIHGVGFDEILKLYEWRNDVSSILESLIVVVARWHERSLMQQHLFDFEEISLIDFYSRRLKFLLDSIETLMVGAEGYGDVFLRVHSVLLKYINNIPSFIGRNERTVMIHGDFRGENLVVDAERGKIWILDYEQGLYGGDWLSDLWKIGIVLDESPTYTVDIGKNLRDKLVQVYLDVRISEGSSPESFYVLDHTDILHGRIGLMRLDLLVSSLIFRYLMGWHFYEAQEDGRKKRRGDKFVLDLIHQFFGLK